MRRSPARWASSKPERIKIIEAAADPVVPVTPGNMLFALAGILAGILAGAGLAGAAEVLDTRLRSRNQFENATKVPVIARLVARGEIPKR
ncbi:MAG: hypothetical protein R3D29_15360 [Nitratireductor sp.]